MHPTPDLLHLLAGASSPAPADPWPVRGALARLEGRPRPPVYTRSGAQAARVREALGALRIPRRPLRVCPMELERAEKEERPLVRETYRSHGAERALQVLRRTHLLSEHTLPHPRWYTPVDRAEVQTTPWRFQR